VSPIATGCLATEIASARNSSATFGQSKRYRGAEKKNTTRKWQPPFWQYLPTRSVDRGIVNVPMVEGKREMNRKGGKKKEIN